MSKQELNLTWPPGGAVEQFYFSLTHRKDLHSAPALLPVGWFSYNTHLHQNLPVYTAHPSRVCFHLIKHHRIPCCDSHQVSWINWTFCYITPKCGPSAQKQVPIYHSPLFSALLGVVLQGRNTMSAFKGMETSCSSTPGFPVWSGVRICLCRVSQVLPGFSSFLQPPKKKKNMLGGIVMVCTYDSLWWTGATAMVCSHFWIHHKLDQDEAATEQWLIEFSFIDAYPNSKVVLSTKKSLLAALLLHFSGTFVGRLVLYILFKTTFVSCTKRHN